MTLTLWWHQRGTSSRLNRCKSSKTITWTTLTLNTIGISSWWQSNISTLMLTQVTILKNTGPLLNTMLQTRPLNRSNTLSTLICNPAWANSNPVRANSNRWCFKTHLTQYLYTSSRFHPISQWWLNNNKCTQGKWCHQGRWCHQMSLVGDHRCKIQEITTRAWELTLQIKWSIGKAMIT
jgi:hypothetical protein